MHLLARFHFNHTPTVWVVSHSTVLNALLAACKWSSIHGLVKYWPHMKIWHLNPEPSSQGQRVLTQCVIKCKPWFHGSLRAVSTPYIQYGCNVHVYGLMTPSQNCTWSLLHRYPWHNYQRATILFKTKAPSPSHGISCWAHMGFNTTRWSK